MGVDELIDFTLRRERIQLHAVPFASLIDGEIGYIPLGLFSEAALAEVQAAAESLRRDGATSFILDLRGNPGGILDQGVGIADLFLTNGLDVVETRGQEGRSNGRLRASSPERYPGVPVVVLVDRGSASASEIVAGALQDHDRAVILGMTTFGKGSVQSLYPLSQGYVLKLTTARWYTPQGRSIERIGSEQENALELLDAGLDADAEEHIPINVLGQYNLPADTAGRPTVTSVAGDEMTVDLTGTADQVPDRPINMPLEGTVDCAVWLSVRSVLLDSSVHGEIQQNDGLTRPIRIIAPKGSLANPIFPAPVIARFCPGIELSNAIVHDPGRALHLCARAAGILAAGRIRFHPQSL
jgi:hypothetical protein